MPTIDVLDADGLPQTIQTSPAPGRAAAADSRPIVLSTEDKTALDLVASRLASILAAVDGLEAAATTSDAIVTATNALLTTLNGYVDGLEGLTGTSNTLATTLNGYVDGLEGLITSLNGFVDGMETLQASTNTKLDTLAGHLDGVETLLGTGNTAAAATNTLIGEVAASPTANTVLDRLKTIATSLSTISGATDQLEGYLDTVETLIASTNTKLDTVNTNLAAATPTGANVIGGVNISQANPGTTNGVFLKQSYAPAKTSVYRNSAAGTNAETIVSGSRMVCNVLVANKGATWAYVKFYNKATTPTVGTDTPLLVVPCPPGGCVTWEDLMGTAFGSGVGIAITGGAANSDATGVAAGDVQTSFQTLA
jgi:ABC-type transporter Mla subunit MlaD